MKRSTALVVHQSRCSAVDLDSLIAQPGSYIRICWLAPPVRRRPSWPQWFVGEACQVETAEPLKLLLRVLLRDLGEVIVPPIVARLFSQADASQHLWFLKSPFQNVLLNG